MLSQCSKQGSDTAACAVFQCMMTSLLLWSFSIVERHSVSCNKQQSTKNEVDPKRKPISIENRQRSSVRLSELVVACYLHWLWYALLCAQSLQYTVCSLCVQSLQQKAQFAAATAKLCVHLNFFCFRQTLMTPKDTGTQHKQACAHTYAQTNYIKCKQRHPIIAAKTRSTQRVIHRSS